MALWAKAAFVAALKAKRTWDRIPPAQRRQILESARSRAAKHGPTVANAVKEQTPVVRDAVKGRASLLGKSFAEAVRNMREETRRPRDPRD
jgi:acyl-CoA reductase-like NAD-dependent aldehyde dehydrogenase